MHNVRSILYRGCNMESSQTAILERIEKQLRNRIPMKYGWKKKVKSVFWRVHTTICYEIYGRPNWNAGTKTQNPDLGVDQFGRDVAEGMLRYIKLLKKRGFQVHTVVVLGSRVKGRWKPESDVDVTVILNTVPKENGLLGLKRWLLLSDRHVCMGIEPSGCYTKREFLHLLGNFNLMALDAVYYGRVVYDDGFWVEVKRRFKEMKRKYKLQKIPLKEMLFII